MSNIVAVDAIEILDSRGRPTLKVFCELSDGVVGSASVPSGASTGRAEAVELRDQELGRYGGLGCRQAVAKVRGAIAAAVRGREFARQEDLDATLVALDGSPNKRTLGANAILGVSLAFARARSVSEGVPLFASLAGAAGLTPRHLPRPTINLFSGGKHAGGQMSIQDVLIVPLAASIDDCLAQAYAVYYAAADWAARRFGTRLLRADEGGLAPPFARSEDAIAGAVEAIEAAGLRPGGDVALAVDVAASQLAVEGRYRFDGDLLDPTELIEILGGWVTDYPIVSLEDGLGEEDWDHWPHLLARLPPKTVVLGDDLLCTNPTRIRRAIDAAAANALLLKVNQVGTLSEALEAMRLATGAGWEVTASARSGETEDDWLADLAVGWGASFIKIGSITQSERLAKYNRLLELERQTGLPVVPA